MHTLIRVLFPIRPRAFPGERWLNIALRSLHLLGVAGIGGWYLLGVSTSQVGLYGPLALGSGVALACLYLWSSAAWLFQLKGLVIVLKVGLLGLALLLPAWRAELFVLVVLLSGLIAHAPGEVRGFGWCPPWARDDGCG
ncbi:hypothetical protein [Thiocystis violacea]|uniref:hypothetical protein n=1 Tax=Thiocystis violacea TaxID=13725 RepID=UPI0019081608|nr:hypothetical protein [Thiocystis violacea]MBK1725322.1 hypothetical protein [Thiocystis violacea]